VKLEDSQSGQPRNSAIIREESTAPHRQCGRRLKGVGRRDAVNRAQCAAARGTDRLRSTSVRPRLRLRSASYRSASAVSPTRYGRTSTSSSVTPEVTSNRSPAAAAQNSGQAVPQICSHSPRVIPACRRILVSSATPMSPRCGLGIRTVTSSRTMNSCFPPEYGPSKPSLRKALTRFRRLVGPTGGTQPTLRTCSSIPSTVGSARFRETRNRTHSSRTSSSSSRHFSNDSALA
jgi:hypothetical protein